LERRMVGVDEWKKMMSACSAKSTWCRRDVSADFFLVVVADEVKWEKVFCVEEALRSRGVVGFLVEESWIESVVSVSRLGEIVDFRREVVSVAKSCDRF
jgi:hypothetical protein